MLVMGRRVPAVMGVALRAGLGMGSARVERRMSVAVCERERHQND
jgi:hypothetical protein